MKYVRYMIEITSPIRYKQILSSCQIVYRLIKVITDFKLNFK